MADQPPAPAPALMPAPVSAGFKLKLKLGGGNTSTTVSQAHPSTSITTAAANASPSLASTSGQFESPAGSTYPTDSTAQAGPSTSVASISGSRSLHHASNEDADMIDANEDGDEDELAHDDVEDYGGEYATSKKAAAKLQRMRKTSTPSSSSNSNAVASTSAGVDAADTTYPHQQSLDPDLSAYGTASPAASASRGQEASKYETSIGSIVLPSASSSTTGQTKRRRPPGEGGTGLGRGWRKGLKGYQKGDLAGTPGPGAGRGETSSLPMSTASTASSSSKRRKVQVSIAPGLDEASLERNADPEEFTPAMAPAGGLITSDKWANGLPGGNEQSRLTASMASAVNKQFPVGPPPKTGSGFLQPQPLDKNTPPVRSWKKVKREIVGPSGIPFSLTIWQGDNESKYADYMVEHPRPPPVDKKAVTAATAVGGDGSPAPEGSYPPSEGGTPAELPSEGGAAAGHTGTPTGRGRGRGRGGRGGGPAAPRRKPGPPKKNKALPPPIAGIAGSTTPIPGSALATSSATAAPEASADSSAGSKADTPDIAAAAAALPTPVAKDEPIADQSMAESVAEEEEHVADTSVSMAA